MRSCIDGLSITIMKAPDKYVPRNFWQKGLYAFPVKALVDANYHCLYKSCLCRGSAQDSVNFEASHIAASFTSAGLLPSYWIAEDPEYICKNGLSTLWRKSKLSGEREKYCDSFIFSLIATHSCTVSARNTFAALMLTMVPSPLCTSPKHIHNIGRNPIE